MARSACPSTPPPGCSFKAAPRCALPDSTPTSPSWPAPARLRQLAQPPARSSSCPAADVPGLGHADRRLDAASDAAQRGDGLHPPPGSSPRAARGPPPRWRPGCGTRPARLGRLQRWLDAASDAARTAHRPAGAPAGGRGAGAEVASHLEDRPSNPWPPSAAEGRCPMSGSPSSPSGRWARTSWSRSPGAGAIPPPRSSRSTSSTRCARGSSRATPPPRRCCFSRPRGRSPVGAEESAGRWTSSPSSACWWPSPLTARRRRPQCRAVKAACRKVAAGRGGHRSARAREDAGSGATKIHRAGPARGNRPQALDQLLELLSDLADGEVPLHEVEVPTERLGDRALRTSVTWSMWTKAVPFARAVDADAAAGARAHSC